MNETLGVARSCRVGLLRQDHENGRPRLNGVYQKQGYGGRTRETV
jgi:hypothetical protein